MASFNPVQFSREVSQEVAKVVWPKWHEVWLTTTMVVIMVTLASLFFVFADQTFAFVMTKILGTGR